MRTKIVTIFRDMTDQKDPNARSWVEQPALSPEHKECIVRQIVFQSPAGIAGQPGIYFIYMNDTCIGSFAVDDNFKTQNIAPQTVVFLNGGQSTQLNFLVRRHRIDPAQDLLPKGVLCLILEFK